MHLIISKRMLEICCCQIPFILTELLCSGEKQNKTEFPNQTTKQIQVNSIFKIHCFHLKHRIIKRSGFKAT